MNIIKYHSIELLHKQKELLGVDIVVTEKLHGTNVRFGNFGGQLFVGSKNGVIFDGEYHNEFDGYKFYNFVLNRFNSLPDGYLFFGEFFGSGIQKGIKYFQDDKKEFACFDIFVDGEFLVWEDVLRVCNQYCIPAVPELGRGRFSVEELNEFRDAKSAWAWSQDVDNFGEGIVVKPLNENLLDRHGKRLIAKYKNNLHKEKAKVSKEPKEKSVHWINGAEYSTYARVENAIDKLRQETSEQPDMKHIPRLLEIVRQDVAKDADNIPNDPKEQKQFFKGAQSNVVRFYQEWLNK